MDFCYIRRIFDLFSLENSFTKLNNIFQLIERVFLRRAFPSLRVQKVAEQSAVELLRLVPEIDLDKILEIAQPVP